MTDTLTTAAPDDRSIVSLLVLGRGNFLETDQMDATKAIEKIDNAIARLQNVRDRLLHTDRIAADELGVVIHDLLVARARIGRVAK